MTGTDDAVAELLRQSLAAWGIAAKFARPGDGAFEISATRHAVRIERASSGLPFRWMVTINGRRSPAVSLLGVLRQLRTALDPGYAASRVRIAPAPPVLQ